jgi:transcriptional regulator NrdR family protein
LGEGAIAPVGQQDHAGIQHVGYGQVEMAVASKVRRGHRRSSHARPVERSGCEAAIASIKQDSHTACREIDDCKVGGTVTVKVAANYCAMTEVG